MTDNILYLPTVKRPTPPPKPTLAQRLVLAGRRPQKREARTALMIVELSQLLEVCVPITESTLDLGTQTALANYIVGEITKCVTAMEGL